MIPAILSVFAPRGFGSASRNNGEVETGRPHGAPLRHSIVSGRPLWSPFINAPHRPSLMQMVGRKAGTNRCNPAFRSVATMDCFAALAMTGLELRQGSQKLSRGGSSHPVIAKQSMLPLVTQRYVEALSASRSALPMARASVPKPPNQPGHPRRHCDTPIRKSPHSV